MKRAAIVTALALALSIPVLSQTASAATYVIGSMNITSGGFSVDGFPDGFVAFNYIGPNTNLVGGYIGSGGVSVDAVTPNPSRIAGADWYGYPMNLYTASASLGDMATPAGTYTGGPVPSGTLDSIAGAITMDLSSLFGNWDDGDYITGTGRDDGITSALATGTWDPSTHAYVLYWDSKTLGPACTEPFGCVSHWTLQGTASPVPVPAALWLFGSGLLGLLGLRRLNK